MCDLLAELGEALYIGRDNLFFPNWSGGAGVAVPTGLRAKSERLSDIQCLEGRWILLDQEAAERAMADLGALVDQVICAAALQPPNLDGPERWIGITNLVSAGQDIVVLAAAIGVLPRRAADFLASADRYPRGL